MKTTVFALTMLAACPALAAPDLATGFKDVCASRAILSDKLKAACLSGSMPRTIKDGSRFDARGVGAELNALIANLDFFRTPKPRSMVDD